MEILKPTIPVFVFLTEGEKVYLQRRYNTGYRDGFYEPPVGKMDYGLDGYRESPQEAGCREVLEEAGVIVQPDDLQLFHAYLNYAEGDPWLGLMFRATVWTGVPSIREPHKCDESGFFDLSDLPKVTPQVRDGLNRLLISNTVEIPTYF